jgi:hypothetical protein
MFRTSILVALLAASLAGQSRQTAPPRPERPKVPLKIFAALGIARYFGSADLWLQNRGSDEKQVAFTWTIDGGRRVEGPPFVLKPLAVEFVDFNAVMPPDVHLANVTGVEMNYRGILATEVSTWITFFPADDTTFSQALDVPVSIPEDVRGSTLDTVWPAPNSNERAIIAVFNTSGAPVTVDVLQRGATETVKLGPYASHLLDRRAGTFEPKAEWLRIETKTPGPNPVRAAGFVRSSTDRIPQILRFHDATDARTDDLFATGVRAANTRLNLSLANISDIAQTATVMLFDPAGGTALAQIPVPLHARSVDFIDVRSRLPSDLTSETVAIRIDGTGPKGSLLANLQAIDRTTGLGFEASFSDVLQKNSGVGFYPWRLDGDYEGRISITSFGTAGECTWSMRTGVEQYGYGIQRIAAGATFVIDLRPFRETEKPSSYYRRSLPKDAAVGQMHWSVVGSGADLGLIGRLELVSLQRRVVRSISDQ